LDHFGVNGPAEPAGQNAPPGRATRLELGQPVSRELAGGETHVYTLKVSAGDFFEACVDRLGMVVDVAAYSPGGRLVAQGDATVENSECDMIAHIAAEAGEYRIETRLLFPNARGGRYRIRLISLRAPTERDLHRALGARAFAIANRRRLRWKEESQQAMAEFQEALGHWRAAGDKTREGLTYSVIGQMYRALGNLPKSTENFEKALSLSREAENKSLEIEAMTDLSYVYAKQSQALRGVALASEALHLSRARNDQYGQCKSLLLLGGISNAAGNVRLGQDYNWQALPLCRAASTPFGERIALTQIADSYVYLGEPQQALNFFNQALQIVTPAFDRFAQGYIRLNLARLKLQIGELQDALAQGLGSRENFHQIGLQDWEADTHLALGAIYSALGDAQQAFNSFNQAFALSAAAGDLRLKALSLSDLAGVSIRLGRQAEAERYLEQAAAAFRDKGLPSSEVDALKQLGRLEMLRERPFLAAEHFNQALALSQKLELAAHETESLWELGTAYLAMDDRDRATDCFEQALQKAREKRLPDFEIQALGGLARLAQKRGDHREAQALLETALGLIETSRARIASPDFRVTFFRASRSFYEAYIDALMAQHEREPGESRFVALALQAVERARARSLLELLTETRADIRQGIDPALLERERELQQRLSAKAERVWLLGQSGGGDQAAAIKAELDALVSQQRDLAAQIRISSPRYAALRQPQPLSLPEIQKRVLDSDTLLLEYALGDQRSFLFAVTQTEIKSFTLPGRAEIERQSDHLLGLLESIGKAQVFKSAEEKLRWERRNRQEYMRISADLSQILLAPVKDLLANKRLMIVSDGALHYVSFAGLPDPAANDSQQVAGSQAGRSLAISPQISRSQIVRSQIGRAAGSRLRDLSSRRLRPLLVDHEIITIPSASTLAVLRQELNGREVAQKTLAALADPVFEKEDERLAAQSHVMARAASAARAPAGNDLARTRGAINENLFRLVRTGAATDLFIPRLPGTRREAEAILALVPQTLRKEAVDFDANRAAAMSPDLGQYRFLHFATHGLLNSESPELSGLVLSLVDKNGAPQNGILRTLDVYNLKLPVELVVLSACRTARGKENGGEGLMGLTRGFFYAGARRVVASLWPVNDAATTELMRRFYQEMLGGKQLSPAAALRSAQVSMWKEEKWSAPYYWAAFTLQGEW
jgi:CHAT domain-containing protein/Tfp pilus assembly protein PilF